jgi:hypothetical protein
VLKLCTSSLVLIALTSVAANAECSGQVVQRPNKQGVVRDVCLDGKYATCIKDSLQGGWTQAEAKRFCGRIKAEGKIK